MPRALILNKALIPDAQRSAYIEHLAQRRQHYAQAKCTFWVFEEAGRPGSFLEFAEAADGETLAAATQRAPGVTAGIPRIYQEVEIR